MKKGFTLLELIIVVIIVGILATIAFTQYSKVTEKARQSEAKTVLSAIRTSEASYYLEHGIYTDSPSDLPTIEEADVPWDGACTASHDFSYAVAGLCDPNACTPQATRCQSGGKTVGATAYMLQIDAQTGQITCPNADCPGF